MKVEPGEHPGQVGDPVVPGDDQVEEVEVSLPVPSLAPVEADLRAEVPALPAHLGLVGNHLGPMQPTKIL